jgi:ankyrin repeat protein
MLLKRGAVIDARNLHGETALHYAVTWNSIPIVRLLLERGADVGARKSSATGCPVLPFEH